MDTVRFARALGRGTRAVARTLVEVAEAATAPNPNAEQAQKRTAPKSPPPDAAKQVLQAAKKVRATEAGIRQGSRNFVKATTAPIVKAGSVLWLEVTGALFGLFAAAGALEAFRHRAGLHTPGDDRKNLILAALMFVVFSAFALSSFLRAQRRARS